MRNTILKNRAIYFGLNAAVMGVLLFEHFSLVNLGICFIVAGLTLYLSVFWDKTNEPACAFLPEHLFADIVLYFALRIQDFQEGFSSDLLIDLSNEAIVAAMLGAVLLAVGIKMSYRWLVWLGSLIFGAALLSVVWANGNLLSLHQPETFRVLLTLHILLTTLWIVLIQVSERAVSVSKLPDTVMRNNSLTIVLLCLLIAMNLLEKDLIHVYLPQWTETLRTLPADMMVGWKVILGVLIFALCTAALHEYSGGSMGTDAYVMASFTGAIPLMMGLYVCFFPLKWVVLLIYAQLIVAPLRVFAKGQTQFGLRYGTYFAAVLFFTAIGTAFFQYDLWLNLVITAVAVTSIYQLRKSHGQEPKGRLLWSTVILSLTAECAGLLVVNRWHLSNFIILALTAVMTLATVLIVNKPHPGRRKPSLIFEGAICVSFALLCAVLALGYGTRIDLSYDSTASQIKLEADPLGEGNEIVSLGYSWCDIGENLPEKLTNLSHLTETLEIKGDRLTIEAVDSHGVHTTRTVWFLWRRLEH